MKQTAKTKQSQLVPSFKATVLHQERNYSVEQYFNPNTNENALCVVRHQTFTDWLTIYDDGRIGFDNPHNIPERIKVKCRRFAMDIVMQRTRANNRRHSVFNICQHLSHKIF